jgi:hypothetical protein
VLWNLHGWVGYALYIAGYAGLVAVYVRVKEGESMRGLHGRGKPNKNAIVSNLD